MLTDAGSDELSTAGEEPTNRVLATEKGNVCLTTVRNQGNDHESLAAGNSIIRKEIQKRWEAHADNWINKLINKQIGM